MLKGKKGLRQVLTEKLRIDEGRREVIELLPSSYDLIGDIATVKIREEALKWKKEIGEAIKEINKRVSTVLRVYGPTTEVYRLRNFEVIWGENKTETVHVEHGCRFKVDLKKAFFNPRLSYERKRLSNLVKSGETILNMFAGVGTTSIIIAKHRPDISKIYSVDINMDAYSLMKENIKINKVGDRVVAVWGDAAEVVRKLLRGKIDRVIMLLPRYAYRFMGDALSAVRGRGMIHYYSEEEASTKSEAISRAVNSLKKLLPEKIKHEIRFCRVVRPVAPYLYHVAVDVEVFRA